MSYASDTLLYYIRILWEQTNLQWNSDNQAEVESIVESIESTIECQIKQELQSASAIQTEQAKASQEAVAMFAEHQKKQLRLSIATPILAALIQADAMQWTSCGEKTEEFVLVVRAIEYATLLLDENNKA